MKFFWIFCLIGIFSACNYNRNKDLNSASSKKLLSQDIGDVDYEMVKNFVLSSQCLSCHSNLSGNKGGLNLESYQAVRGALNKVIYRSLEKKDMPTRGLPEAELRVLKAWIEQGAPEKVIAGRQKPVGESESGVIDFQRIQLQIMAPKCLDCHGPKDPIANLDLTSIQIVRSNITQIFDRMFIKGDMPMSPYPTLTPSERRVFLKWIDMGMPN